MKLTTLGIRICLALAVVVLVIFLMSAFANATTYYVSPDGDDITGDGSESNPWRTISYAVSQASDGDTIKVMDDDDESTDDYVENVTVDKSLTIARYNDIGANPQVKAETDNHVFHVTADNVTIKGLDIYGSIEYPNAGIYLYQANNGTIQDNRCGWDSDHKNLYGILLYHSSNNTVSDNICSNNHYGIKLDSSSNNTVSGNTCDSNNSIGIDLDDSSNNTVSGNTCSNNYYGIYLDDSSNNTLSSNTCDSNDFIGIRLLYSSNNILSGNTCDSNNGDGIWLDGSSDNTLSGNTCNSNKYRGILVQSRSNNNTLSGNTCSNNSSGIYLVYSSYNNTLSGNTCDSNNSSGIGLDRSSNNTVSGNICSSSNRDGIDLVSSSYNTVSYNICQNNINHGIKLFSSNNNTIYLNNFSNNSTNVYSVDSTNIWHSPTKLGYLYGSSTRTYKNYMGNYYSDYTGSDGDGDGVGDTSYTAGDVTDDYPLMKPPDNYDLQAWWLSNPIMYRGDMSQPGAIIIIGGGSYQIWAADQAAPTDTIFGTGDPAEGTTWTGQITFASALDNWDTFMVKVGYADDQNGAGFWEDGPEAVLTGDGSKTTFIYTTDVQSLTVPQGKYLALRITNNNSSNYGVQVGGSWSYVSAPLFATTWYVSPTGDDTNNGTEANPWRTISYAVSQASDSDTIKVMDDDNESTDDYVENIIVDKSLTIERYNDIDANPQVKAENADNHVFHVTADSVTINGLDIYGSTEYPNAGIYLYQSNNCIIQDNRCGWDSDHKNYEGIKLSSSSNNTVSGNTCSANEEHTGGIKLSSSSNNTISDNTCQNNYYGIYLYLGCDNNTVLGNICSPNNYGGIYLSSSSNNTISGNTCSANEEDACGIKLDSSSNNTVSGNTCNSNNLLGIYLSSSSNNTVSGNTCNLNRTGIYLYSSSYNTVSDNTCNKHVYGPGISLYNSSTNSVSGNTCSSNSDGIYLSSSSYNTVSGNTCSSGSNGISLSNGPDNNTIYLNNFSNNSTNVYSVDSTNIWHSPTKLGYLYGSSTRTYKSYMGNYYSDYTGNDGDGDGVGDTPYTAGEMTDDFPLMEPPDNYNLQAWWLANPIMYRGDMFQPGAIITIGCCSYQIWAADQAALTDTIFGVGDPAEETTWTGQVTFASAPAIGDTFTVEMGYADDQNGAGFWEDGPEAMLVGNGSDISFVYTTNALGVTVPLGKYLALKIKNNNSSNYGVQVGGSWSYVAAPLSISGTVSGDVSGNGTVSTYDAAMVLKYVVGLITLTDTQKEAADVSKNGTVSPYDAALILQYVVGLIPSFPEASEADAPILNVTPESELLAKAIKELEDIHLDDEQKRVVEQLKRLLNQQPIPIYTALLQNYPNPFNPETWLPYQLATVSPVVISIYNAKGQMIRTISLGTKRAGVYIKKDRAAYWDGKDSLGQSVASGVYFYTLQAGEFRATQKMVIMK